jgi:hypothetical protein
MEGDYNSKPVNAGCFIALAFLRLANLTGLEMMDQSLPPRPALFFGLMLELKPSGFRQLFSSLRIAHPHAAKSLGSQVRKISIT